MKKKIVTTILLLCIAISGLIGNTTVEKVVAEEILDDSSFDTEEVIEEENWKIIGLETSELEILDEILEGIWIQENSSDAIQMIFDSDHNVKYYATVSHGSDYMTAYNWKEHGLLIDVVNLDEGVTQLQYDLSYSENEMLKKLNIALAGVNEYFDESVSNNWGDIICGTYVQIKPEAIKKSLNVPDDVEIYLEQSEASYWSTGQVYTTYMSFKKENSMVASATVDALTGMLIKDIFMYPDTLEVDTSETSTSEELRKIIADHYNKERDTDEYVVYEEDCHENENGYFMVLRTSKDNNAWVYYVTVDIATGKVTTDVGDQWYLENISLK